MTIDPTTTLADLASGVPAATRVLERLGLDYCCGGRRSLDQACAEKGLDLDEVLGQIQSSLQGDATRATHRDWRAEKASALVRHLLDTHHVYTREQLDRLAPLMHKVHAVHGATHPELAALKQTLTTFDADMRSHLEKEEQILFPYIFGLEADFAAGACFATIEQPITVMLMEHDSAGALLARMRELTNGYALPEGACASYSALYHGLEDLEADVHQHVHLENNVLFPRAIALESTQGAAL